jgi:phosphatidate cytidylyltransferase
LAARLATAAIGIPLTVVPVVLGAPWLVAGCAAVVLIGLAEFYRMTQRAGYRPVWEAGMAAGLLLVVQAAWPQPWQLAIVPATFIYIVAAQLGQGRSERVMSNTAVTLMGPLYVGFLFSFILRLRALNLGSFRFGGPALLVIFVVWAADTAAYFVGMIAGRHKLLPQVSPNKSWEGAAGGVLAGIISGIICGWLFGMPRAMAAAVGGVCAAASIFGDLWESAIKREVGVKDAGSILPGHGGILDRFDGLLFAMAAGYFAMRWWRS